eukprot:GEMP01120026.1.p1 GENE.GEMP01120026.1~~GEMP01120026.1.p1  ORF type:complete len:168 (+),score=35.68 GEMP01120026.1:28-531(+)
MTEQADAVYYLAIAKAVAKAAAKAAGPKAVAYAKAKAVMPPDPPMLPTATHMKAVFEQPHRYRHPSILHRAVRAREAVTRPKAPPPQPPAGGVDGINNQLRANKVVSDASVRAAGNLLRGLKRQREVSEIQPAIIAGNIAGQVDVFNNVMSDELEPFMNDNGLGQIT